METLKCVSPFPRRSKKRSTWHSGTHYKRQRYSDVYISSDSDEGTGLGYSAVAQIVAFRVSMVVKDICMHVITSRPRGGSLSL